MAPSTPNSPTNSTPNIPTERDDLQPNTMANLSQLNEEEPSSHNSDVVLQDRVVGEEASAAGILGLSNDILYLIFEYFRTKLEWLDTEEDDKWQANRQASQASRLVCHRFCAFATPLLFESLTIDLDVESVLRAETLLTQNPLIAASVRTVEVSLACRSPDQARSRLAFIKAREKDLDGMLQWYDERLLFELETWDKDDIEDEFIMLEYDKGWDYRGCCNYTYFQEWMRMTRDTFVACLNYFRIRDALDYLKKSEYARDPTKDRVMRDYDEVKAKYKAVEEYPDDAVMGDLDEVMARYDATYDCPFWAKKREHDVRFYFHLFLEAYELYSEKFQEQLQMIRSGSFARSVARCLTKLRHEGLLLYMTNKPKLKIPWEGGLRDAGWHINSHKRLFRAMAGPHHWHQIEDGEWQTSMHQPSACLLPEILLACYHAGAPVLNLKLECFPPRGECQELFSFSGTLKSMDEWSAELGLACQHFESFEIESRYEDRFTDFEDASTYRATFVSAMLSGGRLERFRGRMALYDLGHVLATAASTWTHLQSLDLGCVTASQEDVERMFRNLADGARFHNFAFSVRLRAGSGGIGSWAKALDILRETLSTRSSDELKGSLKFHLKGGELGGIYADARGCRLLKEDDYDSDTEYAEAKQHVCGMTYNYCDEQYGSEYGRDYESDWEYPFWDNNTERGMNTIMEDNLMDLVQCYVSGDARVSENPLRGDRDALCERIIRWRKDLFLPEDMI